MDNRIKQEGEYFSTHDSALTRSIAWSAIPQVQRAMRTDPDFAVETKKLLQGRSGIKALTLACGDMTGEYVLFQKISTEYGAVEPNFIRAIMRPKINGQKGRRRWLKFLEREKGSHLAARDI